MIPRMRWAAALALCAVLTGPAGGGTYPPEWDTKTIPELTSLAEDTVAQGSREDRELLAEYVAGRYAGASAAGTMDWGQWLEPATVLGPYYPAETQQAMSQDIQQTYAPDDASTAALAVGTLMDVCEALMQLGDTEAGSSLCATWVTGSQKYRTVSLERLKDLTGLLSAGGPSAQPARDRLAGRIETDYLGSDAATRSLSTPNWHTFAKNLGKHLSEARRESWRGRIRSAYLEPKDVLGAQGATEFENLLWALEHLGDDAHSVLAELVTGTEGWRGWEPKSVSRMVARLEFSGEAQKPARLRLAGHVTDSYLTDVGTIKGVPMKGWRRFARVLGPDLTAHTRQQWTEELCEAFASSAQALTDLPYGEFKSLSMALWRLGDLKEPAPVVVLVTDTTVWKDWPPDRLGFLAWRLHKRAGLMMPAREALADHLFRTYLTSASAARQISCEAWDDLARYLREVLTADQMEQWAQQLCSAYAGDARALADLKTKDARRLVAAVWYMDGVRATRVAAAWFEAHPEWAQADPGELIRMVRFANRGEDCLPGRGELLSAELMAQLESAWAAAYERGELDWQDCMYATFAWTYYADGPQKRQWARRTCKQAFGTEQARARAGKWTVMDAGIAMQSGGITGEGRGYEDYARAVAKLAGAERLAIKDNTFRLDKWPKWPRVYAGPLGTDQTRQIVRDALTDADGDVRLPVAKVLAQSHLRAGSLGSWRSFLDAKIEADDISGDAKAGWLVARGYTEAIGPDRDAAAARALFDEAREAAATDALGLAAVEETARSYVVAEQTEEALAFLDEAAGELTSGPAQDRIAAIRRFIRAGHLHYLYKEIAQRQRWAERMEAEAVKAGLEGHAEQREMLLKNAESERRLIQRLRQEADQYR